MNCKLKIFSLLIVLSILWAGCIDDTQTNVQTDYNLKYNLNAGDRFVYDTLYSTEAPKNTVPINVEMLVSDFDGNNITTKITSTIITNGNTTKSSYNAIIDIYGNLIKLVSEENMIPEIQPGLPNTIIYPQKEVRKGESWAVPVRREGSFFTSEMLTSYNISGTRNYTWLGFKKISVKAGDFECVGLKSNINYIYNRVMNNTNGTISIITTGEVIGEDWVDVNGGFVVKSKYNVEGLIMTDLSEKFKQIGFENFWHQFLLGHNDHLH